MIIKKNSYNKIQIKNTENERSVLTEETEAGILRHVSKLRFTRSFLSLPGVP